MSRPPASPGEAIAMFADASADPFDRDAAMRMIDDDPSALPALIRIASDPAEPDMLQQSAASAIGCIWLNQDAIQTGDDGGFTAIAREEIALFREQAASPTLSQPLTVRLADYGDAFDAGALFMLLDTYAKSVQGGGKALDPALREKLAPALAKVPGAFTIFAMEGGTPIGLANCLTGFSTFACAPLVNIHDMAVVPVRRGCGVGRALMRAVEAEAKKRGACKITLEVLAGNEGAKALYASEGYATYALDPAMGSAQFWEKKL